MSTIQGSFVTGVQAMLAQAHDLSNISTNIANVNDHLKPARPWFEFYGAKSADELA